MTYDFSGYATKNDLKCSDGRIIRKGAFKVNDGQTVPLVWQHLHNDPSNVLGHARLENRDDGVYAYCKFNNTEAGQNAKELVKHKDINALSIHANKLVQKGSDVIHGVIKEVSLVLSGANPGALIDNLAIEHGDGSLVTDDTEAIIYTGSELSLDDLTHQAGSTGSEDEKTVAEIFAGFSDVEKDVVYAMISQVLQGQTEINADDGEVKHYDEGRRDMKINVFDKQDPTETEGATLTHSQIQAIFEDAKRCGSLKESVLAHAQEYGIEDIDYLFPDARKVRETPDFIKRDTDWVEGVMAGTHHTPFSRIKSMAADITANEARAKGYVTGAEKKEEIIKLLKRVTGPTTIYKKQKLDRDDIIDITDFNVVSWLKSEMRLMLDEEIARAILIGDGRAVDNADKINEECIRPIYKDDDLYAHKVLLEGPTIEAKIDEIVRARINYKGSGNPTLYAPPTVITDMLLIKDKNGRRIYNTEAELAAALRVSKIVEVPLMDTVSRIIEGVTEAPAKLVGIIVNLKDYTVGTDKGGEVNMFDDFDIDYNQYKYLMETRCSGALTRPKSALVLESVPAEEDGEG